MTRKRALGRGLDALIGANARRRENLGRSRSRGAELDLEDIKASLRSVLWRNVGVERERDGLRYALALAPRRQGLIACIDAVR